MAPPRRRTSGSSSRATQEQESETHRGQAGIEDALRTMTQILGRMDRGREPDNDFQALSEFRRQDPPRFLGEYDPEAAELFIQELEKIFRAMRCSEEQKLVFAVYRLSGEAENWWNDTLRLLELQDTPVTWEVFKNRFLEKYFPQDLRQAKEREFLSLKQGNMSVGEYTAKFETLSKYSRYYQLHPDESWRCSQYVEGLKQDIREVVGPLQLRDFSEVVNRARLVETYRRPKEQSQQKYYGPQRNKGKGVDTRSKPYQRPPQQQ